MCCITITLGMRTSRATFLATGSIHLCELVNYQLSHNLIEMINDFQLKTVNAPKQQYKTFTGSILSKETSVALKGDD